MGFETNTVAGRNRNEYKSEGLLNYGQFPAKAAYPIGTAVKLGADGKLDAALVANDIPFGFIITACKKALGYPTVLTGFHAITVAKADGVIAVGDPVYSTGYDTTNLITKVKKGTAGIVLGIAVEGGATTTEVRIAWFTTPVTIPAS